MSDDIDPSSQIRRSRAGEANTSNGTLAIILAVVAVVAGFLILRSLNNGGTSSATVPSGDTTTTTLVVPDTPAPIPVTTAPTLDFSGATVIVANANTTGGSAGKMTDALKAAGVSTVDPINATSELEVSQILYNADNPNALKVATSLSQILTPAPAPTPIAGEPPLDGDRAGADVILLLGKDLAEAQVALPSQPATTLTVAPSTGSATDGG